MVHWPRLHTIFLQINSWINVNNKIIKNINFMFTFHYCVNGYHFDACCFYSCYFHWQKYFEIVGFLILQQVLLPSIHFCPSEYFIWIYKTENWLKKSIASFSTSLPWNTCFSPCHDSVLNSVYWIEQKKIHYFYTYFLFNCDQYHFVVMPIVDISNS